MKHILIKVIIGAIALFLLPMIIVALLGNIFMLIQSNPKITLTRA